jgi:hypothetical protein
MDDRPDRPIDPLVAATAVGRFVAALTASRSPLPGESGSPQQTRGPPPRLGYSIAEFCTALGISQAHYFEMKRAGEGPREMALGTRRIISIEEAIRWCAERTAISNQPQEAA